MPASRRRRAYGQHFLRDASVIDRIVEATLQKVEQHQARALLEVGPGKGAITRSLLESFPESKSLERFLIVEKDQDLAADWIEQSKDLDRVEVIEADFLKVTRETYLSTTPLVVVSNLPYSAGTAILQELAECPENIPAMVLMFQAEVAHRLRATPGEKAWGSLSLWMQNHWEIRKLISVPPGAFSPPPEVNSEVVVLEARNEPMIRAPEGANATEIAHWNSQWDKLIRVPFLHRRKMLRSGLPKNSIWKESLDQAGIDGTRRAEDLDWNDWEMWMNALHRLTFKV
jgi:16S rRNA (adenine1518-N6/adenine1519-N6)-dimethyltransferase